MQAFGGAIIAQHHFCTLQFQKCYRSLVAIFVFFSYFPIANTTGVMMKIANPNHALFLEQITPKLPSIFLGSSPRKKKNGSTKPLMLMAFLTPRGSSTSHRQPQPASASQALLKTCQASWLRLAPGRCTASSKSLPLKIGVKIKQLQTHLF